jgi:hypothetical protein
MITHFHPSCQSFFPPLHQFTTSTQHAILTLHSLHQSSPQYKMVTMGSKRKRSTDDSPVSISSYTWSTPEAQSPIPQSFDGMDVDNARQQNAWDFSNASRTKSSDWGMRTRKRVRDNRPDERSIHRTYSPYPTEVNEY